MQIAQINIARMIAPLDSPVMQDFVANLDYINGLAENYKGFVWRLKGDDNNATAIRVFEDDFLIINLSVWKDMERLFEFVYQSAHIEVLKRKKEWFEHMRPAHMAIWYIEDDEYPSPQDARERLEYLREHGPTPHAFTFKERFSVSDLNKK